MDAMQRWIKEEDAEEMVEVRTREIEQLMREERADYHRKLKEFKEVIQVKTELALQGLPVVIIDKKYNSEHQHIPGSRDVIIGLEAKLADIEAELVSIVADDSRGKLGKKQTIEKLIELVKKINSR